MWDVVVAGAGPAGALAATILARSGARVLVVDRARFPRDKLCGDSLNPGTINLLRRLNLSSWIEMHGLPIEGMRLSGPAGVRAEGCYPPGLLGRTAMRRDFDHFLINQAVRAGAQFDDAIVVRRALIEQTHKYAEGVRVTGVLLRLRTRHEAELPARVVIAADGRRSILASGLGLVSATARPRRWAVGAYFDRVGGSSSFGEMHIRVRRYLGVAPLPGGLTNACLVASLEQLRRASSPAHALRAAIDGDADLRDRFAGARMVTRPVVLGPLALEARGCGVPGLLLAGDAAGFIDPMTGDGLRFALRGAELAADVALEMLASGDPHGYRVLEVRRRTAFRRKRCFDRVLRRLVDSPLLVRAIERAAHLAPALLHPLVRAAGDCAVCT